MNREKLQALLEPLIALHNAAEVGADDIAAVLDSLDEQAAGDLAGDGELSMLVGFMVGEWAERGAVHPAFIEFVVHRARLLARAAYHLGRDDEQRERPVPDGEADPPALWLAPRPLN